MPYSVAEDEGELYPALPKRILWRVLLILVGFPIYSHCFASQELALTPYSAMIST
jgi:hypothetical protein